MKKVTILAAVVMISMATFAQTWSLDKAHAKLGFTITAKHCCRHAATDAKIGTFKSATHF